MPIIGLTQDVGVGLERIAKMYKGDEKEVRKNKKGEEYKTWGKDLEYFRIEFEPQYAELEALWIELYGEQPSEFEPVFLTAATTDEAFQSWKEQHNSSETLLHRCDGENQVLWYNEDAKRHSTAKVQCASNHDHPCECKPVGHLDLMFPEFCAIAGVLGVIRLGTKSIFDIMTLHNNLTMIERINGTLLGVPLVFGRSKRQITAPKTDKDGNRTGERIKINKSLLYIRSTNEFTQRRLIPILGGAIEQSTGLLATGTEDAKVLSLGNGGTPRRIDTSEPELAMVEPVDPFADVRAKLEEVELNITKITERQIPGTYEVVLNRAVTDVEAFKVWLIGQFGEQIRHVYAESFDFQLAAPTTAQEG